MMASDSTIKRMFPLMIGKKLSRPWTRVESELALPTS
jgi:hypothetical protein